MKNLHLLGTTLWHYTTYEKAMQIIESEVIKPATAFVPKGEKPAVWFSSNQFWENSCNKGIRDHFHPLGIRTATKEEMIKFGGGLVRFGVAPRVAPHNWEDFKRLSGINLQKADALIKNGKNFNYDHNDWWVSFEPVPFDFLSDIAFWNVEKKAWMSMKESYGNRRVQFVSNSSKRMSGLKL